MDITSHIREICETFQFSSKVFGYRSGYVIVKEQVEYFFHWYRNELFLLVNVEWMLIKLTFDPTRKPTFLQKAYQKKELSFD